MTIPRASLLLTALGLLAVATLPAASPATQPNVLVIISDDQSWADYGFMGHPHIATPGSQSEDGGARCGIDHGAERNGRRDPCR